MGETKKKVGITFINIYILVTGSRGIVGSVQYVVICIVLLCTLDSVHCTMYTAHYILYNVHCTLNTVQCTLHIGSVHCTLYTVHCSLYLVNCTLYTVHVVTTLYAACVCTVLQVLYCTTGTKDKVLYYRYCTVLYCTVLQVLYCTTSIVSKL